MEGSVAAIGLSIPAASLFATQETVDGVGYLIDDERQSKGTVQQLRLFEHPLTSAGFSTGIV